MINWNDPYEDHPRRLARSPAAQSADPKSPGSLPGRCEHRRLPRLVIFTNINQEPAIPMIVYVRETKDSYKTCWACDMMSTPSHEIVMIGINRNQVLVLYHNIGIVQHCCWPSAGVQNEIVPVIAVVPNDNILWPIPSQYRQEELDETNGVQDVAQNTPPLLEYSKVLWDSSNA